MNFTSNQANGGFGGIGGVGAEGVGGDGANGSPHGGNGGNAFGGNGGNGGNAGNADGGAINNLASGILTIKPRLGAKKGSKQSKATDLITGNSAHAESGGRWRKPGGRPGGYRRKSLRSKRHELPGQIRHRRKLWYRRGRRA